MLNATSSYRRQAPEKSESKGTTSAGRGHGVDRCAGILRILLLASQSNPYARRQDVRGILLDSYC